VGGRAAGEGASQWLINALVQLEKRWVEQPLPEALRAAVRWAGETIAFLAQCRPKLAGMSATLSAVAMGDDDRYVVVHIGDSRAYLMRETQLIPLTRDDSLVARLVEQGVLTPEAARHHPQRSVVLAAVDGSPDVEPAIAHADARPGDRLLVCSDGLTDAVEESVIARTLQTFEGQTCAQELVGLALAAGGRDNVTVVVADVVRTEVLTGWARSPAAA
jgi:PPM family protein phosphatase